MGEEHNSLHAWILRAVLATSTTPHFGVCRPSAGPKTITKGCLKPRKDLSRAASRPRGPPERPVAAS